MDANRPRGAELASLKTEFNLGSGAIGTLAQSKLAERTSYEVAQVPSQTTIERGRAICDCDEIMQISPRFD